MGFYTYLTIATVFITAPLIVEATPRHDELMCEEVTEAVNESVQWGTLTQEEADHISNRCYELYT